MWGWIRAMFSDEEIDRDVAERIETGQFDAIRVEDI